MDAIPLDDRGLLLGDGLFETILAIAGRPLFLEAHLARLARGCALIGLPQPDEVLARQAVDDALTASPAPRAAVRLTWTAGSGGRGLDRPAEPAPRLFATAAPSPEPARPVRLAIASVRRNPASPLSRVKSLAYLDNVLARREALAAGADEAVMLNTLGEVACAAAANLFWVKDGRLCTPALECGVLDGIARAQVLEAAALMGSPTAEVHAGIDALEEAEAIFLTNSLIGLRAVERLGGRDLAPHALVSALSSAWENGLLAA